MAALQQPALERRRHAERELARRRVVSGRVRRRCGLRVRGPRGVDRPAAVLDSHGRRRAEPGGDGRRLQPVRPRQTMHRRRP